MAKPHAQMQIDFLSDLLSQGMTRKEILPILDEKWPNLSIKTKDRRLIAAKNQLQARRAKIIQAADMDIQNDVKLLKSKILTVAERMEILTKIALGEIPLLKPVSVDGQIEMVEVVPAWSDRREAIAELNKMCGDYAPVRQKLSIVKLGLDAIEEKYTD